MNNVPDWAVCGDCRWLGHCQERGADCVHPEHKDRSMVYAGWNPIRLISKACEHWEHVNGWEPDGNPECATCRCCNNSHNHYWSSDGGDMGQCKVFGMPVKLRSVCVEKWESRSKEVSNGKKD